MTGEAMILVDAQDITESHFAERMLATENGLMQMIARGTPLDKIAHALVQAIEQFSSGMLCSLQLLNPEETRLDLAAGPNLPAAYRLAIENLAVGPDITGCFVEQTGEQTRITEADQASSHNSSHIANHLDIAVQHGLYPSWSTPVVSSTGETLGVLAGYYRERREPDVQVRRVIDSVRHLAGIAVERIRAANALEQSAQYLRLVIDSMPALVAYVDRDERFRFINKTFERWFGYSSEQIHGMKVESIASPDLYRIVKPYVDRALAGESVTYERQQPVANSASRYLEVSYVPDIAEISDEKGGVRQEVRGFVSLMTDITARKADEERLHFLARHDQLTGLPNRALFIEHLSFALTQAARNGAKVAVLFIDLDRFKNVNDTLGHPIGDRLLQAVAKRFRGGVREGDTVARLGGDEFTILISAYTDLQSLGQIAQKLLDALAAQLSINGNELYMTASIGISIFPDDAQDVAMLIRNSDIAMYRAKSLGKNTYAFFSPQANTERYEHLRLETGLRRALENNEFEIHYQPRVSIDSGRILGMEALLRWNHPQLGRVPPLDFIPLAEETGLIVPIGTWVIHTVCAQVKAWQDAAFETGCTSINLSALQFRQLDLAATIARILDETGLAAKSIEFELTESSVMADAQEAIAVLHALKSMGLRLAIDDFGTGYSSLSYLKRFPIDTLKIDQSFVRDILADTGDAAITEAVIAMAMSLRLRVIAEGVETREQLAFLRKHRCHEAQGYLFSRPLPAHKFESLLMANTTYSVDVRG
ncbi:MAG: putative bifunctional diguanylate cyclase/phosphodiesterase [Burkholderiales bacterium]|nr:EAL domain-containing protein [Pseudomonadota bacterium]